MTDREAFEAAMRVRGWTAYDFEWDVDDYGCHDSRLAWAVWQAAIKQEREAQIDVGAMEYRGNTVSYIFDKKDAYSSAIGRAFDALREAGTPIDGKTELCDLIRAAIRARSEGSK